MTLAGSSVRPARRLRRPRSERSAEILEAATKVFSEKVLDVAPLHDAADGLDMLWGSLHDNADSGEALPVHISAAHDVLVGDLALGPGSAFDRLIAGHLEFVCGNVHRTRVFLHELLSLPVGRRPDLLGDRRP